MKHAGTTIRPAKWTAPKPGDGTFTPEPFAPGSTVQDAHGATYTVWSKGSRVGTVFAHDADGRMVELRTYRGETFVESSAEAVHRRSRIAILPEVVVETWHYLPAGVYQQFVRVSAAHVPECEVGVTITCEKFARNGEPFTRHDDEHLTGMAFLRRYPAHRQFGAPSASCACLLTGQPVKSEVAA